MRKRIVVMGGHKSRAIAGLVLSVSLLSCVAAGAQEQRVALVIGNGRYQHNATLVNPPNDAADMAAALKKDGFTVTLLTDASRKAMEQAVRAFGNSLKNPDAIGMFYYSGHGAQVEGENYLIPADADIQDADELAYNAVDAESILAKMRSAGNKINIVVLDACRDNPFPGSSRSAAKGLAVVKVKVPESVIVYATDPGSTASDGTGRNSPFTKAFLENMDAPGQDITEVMKRVTSRVQTDTDGKQTPWVSTNLTKDFSFKSTSGPNAATPTMTVMRLYGSLMVTAATEGTLYLDGKAMGDVPAGASAKLDSVEAGNRSLELRYADGQVEQHTATVQAESAASVSFIYRKAPPVQGGSAVQTDFFKLARNGSPQEVRAAIDQGADVNAQDKDGMTPLIYAAQYNLNPEVITMLLAAGALVDARNPEGWTYTESWTPLMWAAMKNQNAEVISTLLKAGADCNAQSQRRGRITPLMLAARYNPNPEVIVILLKAGANAKVISEDAHKTAFDYARNNIKLIGTDALKQLQEASK
ncbi:MAG: caspase family protein [Spirochaetia bacterium]